MERQQSSFKHPVWGTPEGGNDPMNHTVLPPAPTQSPDGLKEPDNSTLFETPSLPGLSMNPPYPSQATSDIINFPYGPNNTWSIFEPMSTTFGNQNFETLNSMYDSGYVDSNLSESGLSSLNRSVYPNIENTGLVHPTGTSTEPNPEARSHPQRKKRKIISSLCTNTDSGPTASSSQRSRAESFPDNSVRHIDDTCESFLYTWMFKYHCQQPSDEELNSLAILTKTPKDAIYHWFRNKSTSQRVASHENKGKMRKKEDLKSENVMNSVRSNKLVQMSAGPSFHQTTDHDLHPTRNDGPDYANVKVSQDDKLLKQDENLLRVHLSTSLNSVIEEVIRKSGKGCPTIRKHEKQHGNFHCTFKCGRRFSRSHEWTRHLKVTNPQEFWFCKRCGDPTIASSEFIFTRKDKFRKHVYKKHQAWPEGDALKECRVDYPAPFKRRCGFCTRNKFRATSWSQWTRHVGKHFKKALPFELWHDWPEDGSDDDEDECGGGEDDDSDYDQDDNDDYDNNDNNDGHDDGNGHDDGDHDDEDDPHDGSHESPSSNPHWHSGPLNGSPFSTDTNFPFFEFGNGWRCQHLPILSRDSTQSIQWPQHPSDDKVVRQVKSKRKLQQLRCLFIIDVEGRCIVAIPWGAQYFVLVYEYSKAQAHPQALCRRFEFVNDELPSSIKDGKHLLKRFGEHYLWMDGIQSVAFALVPTGSFGFTPNSKSESFQPLWLCKDFPTAIISAPIRSIIFHLGFFGRSSHGWVDKVKALSQGQFYVRKPLGLLPSDKCQIRNKVDFLKSIDHPHILSFVGAYLMGSSLIIIEPVAEADLKHVLETPERWAQVLEEIPRWFGCLASALSYLHEQKGVLHCNIKPANILVWSGNVALTDFSLAAEIGNDTKREVSPLKQMTLMYAAPESYSGRSLGPDYDIWSLGCVFAEMVSVSLNHTLSEFHKFIGLNAGTNPSTITYSAVSNSIHAWLLALENMTESEMFHSLLELVHSMLNVKRSMRPSATSVKEEIYAIMSQHSPISAVQAKCELCEPFSSKVYEHKDPLWSTLDTADGETFEFTVTPIELSRTGNATCGNRSLPYSTPILSSNSSLDRKLFEQEEAQLQETSLSRNFAARTEQMSLTSQAPKPLHRHSDASNDDVSNEVFQETAERSRSDQNNKMIVSKVHISKDLSNSNENLSLSVVPKQADQRHYATCYQEDLMSRVCTKARTLEVGLTFHLGADRSQVMRLGQVHMNLKELPDQRTPEWRGKTLLKVHDVTKQLEFLSGIVPGPLILIGSQFSEIANECYRVDINADVPVKDEPQSYTSVPVSWMRRADMRRKIKLEGSASRPSKRA